MNLTDINFIKALLAENGFRFSKSLGQNFLIDASVPRRIADSAMLDKETGVVEVGPGVGCLSVQLAERAGKLVCIELDNALRPILGVTLSEHDNIEVLFQDALKVDFQELKKERFGGMKLNFCANLPYNVTSPLLTAIVTSGAFEYVTVMIQREVAHRICAKPGTAEYGSFGIFMNWYCESELLFDVPPSCFVPQPKVTSTVIRLKKREIPPCAVNDEQLMFKIIRAAFNQRRKTLSNAISSAIGGISKERIAEIIENCGLDARVRGEKLSIAEFAKIADEIGKEIQ